MRFILGFATAFLGAMFIVAAATMPEVAEMREPVPSWTIAIGSIWGGLVTAGGLVQILDWVKR